MGLQKFFQNLFGSKRRREEDDDDDLQLTEERSTRQRGFTPIPSVPRFRINRELTGFAFYEEYERALAQYERDIHDYDQRIQIYLQEILQTSQNQNQQSHFNNLLHFYNGEMTRLRRIYDLHVEEKNSLLSDPAVIRGLRGRAYGFNANFGRIQIKHLPEQNCFEVRNTTNGRLHARCSTFDNAQRKKWILKTFAQNYQPQAPPQPQAPLQPQVQPQAPPQPQVQIQAQAPPQPKRKTKKKSNKALGPRRSRRIAKMTRRKKK